MNSRSQGSETHSDGAFLFFCQIMSFCISSYHLAFGICLDMMKQVHIFGISRILASQEVIVFIYICIIVFK